VPAHAATYYSAGTRVTCPLRVKNARLAVPASRLLSLLEYIGAAPDFCEIVITILRRIMCGLMAWQDRACMQRSRAPVGVGDLGVSKPFHLFHLISVPAREYCSASDARPQMMFPEMFHSTVRFV
jgi:hypothetical protein